MKTLLPLASCLLPLLLASCSVRPFTYADGTGRKIASLGGSILTKSKSETGYMQMPDGTVMSYTTTGKNEVSVPNTYMTTQMVGDLAELTAGVEKNAANNATKVELGKQSVEKTKITTEAATEAAALAAP